MSDGILSLTDATNIGFKIADMADRVKVMHSVVPGSRAEWRFVMDEVGFDVVVTVAAPKPDATLPDPPTPAKPNTPLQ